MWGPVKAKAKCKRMNHMTKCQVSVQVKTLVRGWSLASATYPNDKVIRVINPWSQYIGYSNHMSGYDHESVQFAHFNAECWARIQLGGIEEVSLFFSSLVTVTVSVLVNALGSTYNVWNFGLSLINMPNFWGNLPGPVSRHWKKRFVAP